MTDWYKLLILSLIVFCSCGPEKKKGEVWKGHIDGHSRKYSDSTSLGKSDFKFGDTVITISFKKKSFNISPSDLLRLNQLSSFCASDQVDYIKIVGFTDTTGTDMQNDILAKKRVKEVFKYLDRKNKLESDALYMTWLGESEEVYDLHFQPTHPQQNCVDIWFRFRRTSR